jgi:hypothetical protein
MRSKYLVCAAIAAVGVSGWFVSVAPAQAKDAGKDTAKDAKKKPAELHADEKSMKKQTQWEDKVMGPDSKRIELEKIARARAINEKAEKERERQAALEPTAPAAAPAPAKKNAKSEVSLISPEKNEASRPHEISPQLASEAAQKAPPPSKPADDKFIDKLLREEDAPSKKHASSNDKELDSLLAGAKEKPRKKGDSVDDLLKTADKGPAMPAPRAQSSGLPDWAKQPEIAPTPAAPPPPPPVAAKPAVKNTGVIQVVQGAAGNAPAVISPARNAPMAARTSRKPTVAKAPATWSDPFADKRPVASAQTTKKEPTSRPAPSSDTSWNDPFANEPSETRKTVHHATPPAAPASAPKRNEKAEPGAHPTGWKDPFTKAAAEPTRAPVAMREPAHAPVAMRELTRSESSKWEIAAHHPAARASAADGHAAGAWGVLKKRAR